jgi:hypothetical protein
VATGRQVDVELAGRRVPRPGRATIWLPDADGRIAPSSSTPSVLGRLELRHQVLAGGHGRVAG